MDCIADFHYTLAAKDPKQRGVMGSLGAYSLGDYSVSDHRFGISQATDLCLPTILASAVWESTVSGHRFWILQAKHLFFKSNVDIRGRFNPQALFRGIKSSTFHNFFLKSADLGNKILTTLACQASYGSGRAWSRNVFTANCLIACAVSY